MTLWFGHFPIQAIWEAAKWNGIHPAFLMENPKSIGVSLWNCRGPWVPSCGWRAYPNNPGQIVCFSAAQLLTFFKRKTTDRHFGVDNKKKHGVCDESESNNMCVECFCIHTCGKGRRKNSRFVRPPGNHQIWDVLSFQGSDSGTVSHLPSFKFSLDCISTDPDLGVTPRRASLNQLYTLKQIARGFMWRLRETLSYLYVQNVAVRAEPGENSPGLLFWNLYAGMWHAWRTSTDATWRRWFLFTFLLFWL